MKKQWRLLICALLLFVTFFTVHTINVVAAKSVYIGGQTIGISMEGEGITISGTYDAIIGNKTYNPGKHSDIKVGDIIIKANNSEVDSIKDFLKILLKTEKGSNEVNLLLIREGSKINRNLSVYQDLDGTFKTGLYVKERLLGIGTLTFYDPETKMYGALGHEVIDNDTKEIYPVEEGNIFESDVTGITKSSDGKPGGKVATIDESQILGTIMDNSIYGIYGEFNGEITTKEYEVGYQSQIHLGEASILTVVEGNKIEEFSINITHLEKQDKIATKGITFEVTDKELLKVSNGIVQGMSGSPIIQDNLLIGAVTHVLTNNVDNGYGIYIEWMLQHAAEVE